MKFGDGGVRPPPVLEGTEQVSFNDVLVDLEESFEGAFFSWTMGTASPTPLPSGSPFSISRLRGLSPAG